MSIIKIFKYINSLKSFMKPKNRHFFYLNQNNNFKKIFLTNDKYFNKNDYKKVDICKLELEQIKKKNLKQYRLIIISDEINYFNNQKIKKILNYLITKKKKIIIEGYTL